MNRNFFRARRPFKLTKGGWIFILYTIGVGAGAINTGNNLLYLVFGLFLGLIMASGVLSDLTLWGLEALAIPPQEGRVGEPLLFPVAVRNAKTWFPSLGIRVEVRGLLNGHGLSAVGFCAAVKPGCVVDSIPVFHPAARGLISVSEIVFSTRFPFGLLTKIWTTELSSPVESLVLPRLLKREPELLSAAVEAAIAERTASRRGEGPTLFGIRDFQPADNPRRIHWKASAKRNDGWLVREMEEEETETLRLRWPDVLPVSVKNNFEGFVSYVATLVSVLESRRHRAVILGVDGPLNRFLALVQPDFQVVDSDPSANETAAIDLVEAFERDREAA